MAGAVASPVRTTPPPPGDADRDELTLERMLRRHFERRASPSSPPQPLLSDLGGVAVVLDSYASGRPFEALDEWPHSLTRDLFAAMLRCCAEMLADLRALACAYRASHGEPRGDDLYASAWCGADGAAVTVLMARLD